MLYNKINIRKPIDAFLACPKKYLTAIGGVVCFMVLSSISLISTTSPYYMSYMQIRTHSKGARYSYTIFLKNILLSFNSLSAIIFGLLKDKFKYNFKQMFFVGMILWSSGFFISYFTLDQSFFLFALCYTFLCGTGLGLSFIVPIALTTKWFPDSQGKVTALLFIGMGIGATIYPEFASYYINPLDLKPDKEFSSDFPDEKYFSDKSLLDRVPNFYLYMGIISISLMLLSFFLMHEPVETLSANDKSKKVINISSEEDNDRNLHPRLTLIDALKIKDLYIIAFIIGFGNISLEIFNENYKNYGQTFIHDDKFLTWIFTIAVLINIPTRMIWGIIADKLSFKMTYLIILTASFVLLFTVCFNQYFGNKYTYLIYFSLVDFLLVGYMILQPKVYINRFGHNNIVVAHGLIKFLGIPGGLTGSAITPPLLDGFGYFWLFTISNVFPFLTWITLFCWSAKDRSGNDL